MKRLFKDLKVRLARSVCLHTFVKVRTTRDDWHYEQCSKCGHIEGQGDIFEIVVWLLIVLNAISLLAGAIARLLVEK